MMTANHSIMNITEMELESIYNYAIKECFETILDETEYFFQNKEHLIDIFIEGLDFSKLSPKSVEERFYKVFYNNKEIENFLIRTEKRIKRELERASIEIHLDLQSKKIMDLFDVEESFLLIYEAARTYKLSCSTEKAVNNLWKKSSKSFMPKPLIKVGMGVNVGEYFLSTVGLTPKEIKCDICGQVAKRVRGILKNNKLELIKCINSKVVAELLKSEGKTQSILSNIDVIETTDVIKTA